MIWTKQTGYIWYIQYNQSSMLGPAKKEGTFDIILSISTISTRNWRNLKCMIHLSVTEYELLLVNTILNESPHLFMGI